MYGGESYAFVCVIVLRFGYTVVALGYLLYEQIAQLKKNAVSILTAVFAGCVTGIVSVIFIARGLALGSAAHGLGTARAMELGTVEGAVSGLAIGVMGVMTAILVPVIELILSIFNWQN